MANPGDRSQEDSFERCYNKDLDLDEDQVPVVIYELNESAINFISQESYEKALILLQKAQTMLEQIQANQNPKDQFVFLLTLHNMAMCYQKQIYIYLIRNRLGILEECAICLEACIQCLNSPSLQEYFNDPLQPPLRLKMLKYKCKTHMQICALLSQVHKHKEAVIHAKEGIKIAHFLIKDVESLATFYNNELLQRKPLQEISIINNPKYSLLEKTSVKLLPIFKTLRKRMALEDTLGISSQVTSVKSSQTKLPSAQIDDSETDMKNLLGYLNQSEWIYSLNIGNIMQISPLTLQDFMSSTALEMELSREYVLEKFCFLAVSYFCMGTEFRFLHQLQEMLGEQIYTRRDSEYWHGKAVEIAISFLPSESPLVSHILMSYEKHHSPSNMIIPEDEQQEIQVKVLRQIRGIDSSKLQPIIRHHNDKDFKVPKIDIEPIDYQFHLTKKRSLINNMILINNKLSKKMKENNVIIDDTSFERHDDSNSQIIDDNTDDDQILSSINKGVQSLTRKSNQKIGKGPQILQQDNYSKDKLDDKIIQDEIINQTADSRGQPETNNKNMRKLKKPIESESGLVQAMLNQSATHIIADESTSSQIIDQENRRAKSSLGENSISRLRNKLITNKVGNNEQIQQQQQAMLQQLRGNSSSAMARINPQLQKNGQVGQIEFNRNKSNIDQINDEQIQNSSLIEPSGLQNMRQQSASMMNRRFKGVGQDLNNNETVQLNDQSIDSINLNSQILNQQAQIIKQRNEQKRQNSTSRERTSQIKGQATPITDIRSKKQTNTINIDELPSALQHENSVTLSIQARGAAKNNRILDQSVIVDPLNTSLERDLINPKLNMSTITHSNNQVIYQSVNKRMKGQQANKGRQASHENKGKINNQSLQQQLIGFAGIQNSSEGIMQMIKKRDKLNNSALGTTTSNAKTIFDTSILTNNNATPQIVSHLNKLYSQKRTPTAGGSQQTGTKKVSSAKKDKLKFTAALTADHWNTVGHPSLGSSANVTTTNISEMQHRAMIMNATGGKGIGRKNSKENTNMKPNTFGSMLNNLMSGNNSAVNQQQINLIESVQHHQQYDNWLQFQNKQKRKFE